MPAHRGRTRLARAALAALFLLVALVPTTGAATAHAAPLQQVTGAPVAAAGLGDLDPVPVSVMSLNLHGAGTCEKVNDRTVCIPWETKVHRMTSWLRNNQAVPDVIALQETFGFLHAQWPRSCAGSTGVPAWRQMDELVLRLREQLGITYRVAYLTGSTGSYGFIACTQYVAQAMLYRPDRLRNETALAAGATEHSDARVFQPHLRRSLPMCDPGPLQAGFESLIDGSPQTAYCLGFTRTSPSAPAWAMVPQHGHIISAALEFSLVRRPDAGRVVVHNMHPNSEKAASDQPLMENFVDHVQSKVTAPLYYPPILTGDFNDSNPGAFARPFVPVREQLPGDVVMTFTGSPASYPSQQPARATEVLIAPNLPPGQACQGSTRVRISDHCGLFTRFGGTRFTWPLVSTDRSTRSIAAGSSKLYRLASDGRISRYTGTPLSGWEVIDANPATRKIVADGARLYQLHDNGSIWRYTGTPMTGWELLDTNPATSSIAADGGRLYQLHNNGSIWRYTGTPITGWQLIDNNPASRQIVAGGGRLYQRHEGGAIFEYTGTPITGWRLLDANPATRDIVSSGYRLYQRHAGGQVYRYNGTPESGWALLAGSGPSKQLVAAGERLYSLDQLGVIRRYSGSQLSGWVRVHTPTTATVSIAAASGRLYRLSAGGYVYRLQQG